MSEESWRKRAIQELSGKPAARRKIVPCCAVGKPRRPDGVQGPLEWKEPGLPGAASKPALTWEEVDGVKKPDAD